MNQSNFKRKVISTLITLSDSLKFNNLEMKVNATEDGGYELVINDLADSPNAPSCKIKLNDENKQDVYKLMEDGEWTNCEDAEENIYDNISLYFASSVDNAIKLLGMENQFPTSFKEFVMTRQTKKKN